MIQSDTFTRNVPTLGLPCCRSAGEDSVGAGGEHVAEEHVGPTRGRPAPSHLEQGTGLQCSGESSSSFTIWNSEQVSSVQVRAVHLSPSGTVIRSPAFRWEQYIHLHLEQWTGLQRSGESSTSITIWNSEQVSSVQVRAVRPLHLIKLAVQYITVHMRCVGWVNLQLLSSYA